MSCFNFKWVESPRRVAGRLCAPLASLSLFLCLAAPASAQSNDSPPQGEDVPLAPQPAPVSKVKPRRAVTPAARPSPTRVPMSRPAPAAPAQDATPTPAAAPAVATIAPEPARPPSSVVTVVHRLSSIKLLSSLARHGKQEWRVDELPPAEGFHTNIVAGVIVGEDGRTVVARLPRADAEASAAWPGLFQQQTGIKFGESDITLVLGDGRRVKAKFVGLDAATGLSFLEAAEPLLAPTPEAVVTPAPSVGQRVRLYAPAPAPPTSPAPAARPAPPGVENAAGDAGDTEVIYLGIGETEGHLTEVKRAPSGRPLRATVSAPRITPAWTGAIATNDSGEVMGILLDSGETDPEIVSVETMRGAAERVLARRASVPQPWLGAGGSAVSNFSLADFTAKGWKYEFAWPLINMKQGVLLTTVVPGAPAAAAGLKPGDVILRVGGRDVRGVDDFSFWLKEAGAGSTLNFTVWRATEKSPLDVAVRLSAVENPALASIEAEMQDALRKALADGASARQAQAELREANRRLQTLQSDLRALKTRAKQLKNSPRDVEFSYRLEEIEARLRVLEGQISNGQAVIASAQARYADAARRAALAETQAARSPRPYVASQPLFSFGLRSVELTARSAAKFKARGGLYIVSVREGSPAATAGLLPGDVVETVNGRPVLMTRTSGSRMFGGATELTLGVIRDGKRMTVSLHEEGERNEEARP